MALIETVGDDVSFGANRSFNCKWPPATSLAFNLWKLPLLSSFSFHKFVEKLNQYLPHGVTYSDKNAEYFEYLGMMMDFSEKAVNSSLSVLTPVKVPDSIKISSIDADHVVSKLLEIEFYMGQLPSGSPPIRAAQLLTVAVHDQLMQEIRPGTYFPSATLRTFCFLPWSLKLKFEVGMQWSSTTYYYLKSPNNYYCIR